LPPLKPYPNQSWICILSHNRCQDMQLIIAAHHSSVVFFLRLPFFRDLAICKKPTQYRKDEFSHNRFFCDLAIKK